jgi:hypothetical protein
VNPFLEGKTHRFQILTDVSIEVTNRFVLVAIEKALGNAEERLIGIDFDFCGTDLPRIAKTRALDLIQTVFRARSWPGLSMAVKGMFTAADITFTSLSVFALA